MARTQPKNRKAQKSKRFWSRRPLLLANIGRARQRKRRQRRRLRLCQNVRKLRRLHLPARHRRRNRSARKRLQLPHRANLRLKQKLRLPLQLRGQRLRPLSVLLQERKHGRTSPFRRVSESTTTLIRQRSVKFSTPDSR